MLKTSIVPSVNTSPAGEKSVLIVDAGNLFAGAKKLEARTNRKIDINKQTMGIVLEYM